jgi:ankyrin repeat protein
MKINNIGLSSLHLTARKKRIDMVKLLVDLGANKIVKETPLRFSTLNGHADAVMLLVELGADKNTKDDNERSLLHFATYS